MDWQGNARDGADANAAPVSGRINTEGYVAYEEKITTRIINAVDNTGIKSYEVSEHLVLMRGITGRLDRLEESQTKLMENREGC